jgi:hypothetical protein
MLTVLLLALAYGSADMSFPWWVWMLSVFFSSDSVKEVVRIVTPQGGK